eukprot:194422_1
MKKKKLLFLNINGVLNDKKSKLNTIKPKLIMKLKKIINFTQCKIVLISPDNNLKKKFKKTFIKIARLNVNNIYIGDTPIMKNNEAYVHGIKEYLEKNNEQKNDDYDNINWCVVHHSDLINENESEQFLNGHWVQTNIENGLNDENVEQIISILNAE